MVYSKLYLENKIKIPTMVGFLFIIFITLIFLGISSRLSKSSSAIKTNIRRLEITNISPSSVTIFWQSDKKEVSWLIYGTSPKQMKSLAFDEREYCFKKKFLF